MATKSRYALYLGDQVLAVVPMYSQQSLENNKSRHVPTPAPSDMQQRTGSKLDRRRFIAGTRGMDSQLEGQINASAPTKPEMVWLHPAGLPDK